MLAIIGFLEVISLMAIFFGFLGVLICLIRKRKKSVLSIMLLCGVGGIIVLNFIATTFFYEEMVQTRVEHEKREEESSIGSEKVETKEISSEANEAEEITMGKEETSNKQEFSLEAKEDKQNVTKEIGTENLLEIPLELEKVSEEYEFETKDIQKESVKNDKYKLNNFIELYNSEAEYEIDLGTMGRINEIKRPLERLNYSFQNGVYVIITYNDYNKILFVDYQEENNTDELIYPIFRDFCKTFLTTISDERINEGWEKLRSLEYEYYNEYDLDGVKCTYSTQRLIDGRNRYYIKTYYQY